MLRTALIAIGAAALFCGLIALATGAFPLAAVFGAWGAVLVLAVLFERFRYKALAPARPGPGWQRTAERFVDDETGQNVTVYIEPGTGERAYVRE
ncbi:MAG: hypothetical protein WDN01_02620 [Rhizomicrobium sp.]